jgi:LytS/YehU family sensor histidine kinase
MLLQPLLENALHHGEPPVGGRSVVQVEATATALGTTIVVRNRIEQVLGSAMAETVAAAQEGPAPRASGLGIGLQATRRRLAILYPDGTAKLSTSLSDDAYVVTIHLPHTTGSRLPAPPAGGGPRDSALSALSARPA